jgi:osmoprotectant transport system substrate-binding protein
LSSRALTRGLAALALAVILGSCGGGGAAQRATSTNTTTGPGAGKPPVTIGTKNFPEAYLLGELYAQALRAKGFRVTLKTDIGATELIYRALTSKTLDMYPEYTGVLDAVIGNRRSSAASEDATYRDAQRVVAGENLVLLDKAPFSDRDAIAVKPALARRYKLDSLEDLARVPGPVTVAGPPEFRTREQGMVGLADQYGLTNLRFKPFKIGEQYTALDKDRVDAIDVFTTDGQLNRGRYAVLKDPKGLFGFQNGVPLVRKDVLDREGPEFAQTLNAVSALLTTSEMRRMNAAMAVGARTPTVVAGEFLREHGLK